MAVGNLAARQGGTVPLPQAPNINGVSVGFSSAGGQFRARQGSNVPAPPNPVAQFLARSLEPIVRPAVSDKAYRLLDRLVAARPVSGDLPEASLLWGQASDFDVQELKAPEKPTSPGISIVDGNDDGVPDEDPGPTTFTYTEVSRKEHKVRIENPQDSEQWVEFMIMDEWTGQRDDGVQVVLVFQNPS